MKQICLLGATGSVGTQVLEIIENNPLKYRLVAFTFNKSIEKARQILKKHRPRLVVCGSTALSEQLKQEFPWVSLLSGPEALTAAATFPCDNPIVVNALVGAVGCLPTAAAIRAGRNVLLANKETLVMAGEIIMNLAQQAGVKIIPIDSEHAALTQILYRRSISEVKRLILTASGGPFLGLTRDELKNVTKAAALNHPQWRMGAKISIDSATMANKGFEIIEAFHLFGLPLQQIEAVIHPQSIVHSLVEFQDHTLLAQLANTDMRIPINYALTYPAHRDNGLSLPLKLDELSLSFQQLSTERFPLVSLAKLSLKKGSFYPAVLNAGNEALVELFLQDKIMFWEIDETLKKFMMEPSLPDLWEGLDLNLNNIMKVDRLVKNKILMLERKKL